MLCPVDGTSVLVMTERQGIEIDYCPTCRGVWLDRGELDKIIERSASETSAPPRMERYAERERPRDYDDDRHEQGYHKRRKKGLLGDLFDFD